MKSELSRLDRLMRLSNFREDLVSEKMIELSLNDINKRFMNGGDTTVHFKNRKCDRDVTHGEINNLINHPTTNIRIMYVALAKGAISSITYNFYGYIDNELWLAILIWDTRKKIIPITVVRIRKTTEKDPHGWTEQSFWYNEKVQEQRGYYFSKKIVVLNNANNYFDLIDNDENPFRLEMNDIAVVELVRRVEYNGKTYYVVCWEDPKTFELYFSNRLIPKEDICMASKVDLCKENIELDKTISILNNYENGLKFRHFFVPSMLSVYLLALNQEYYIYFGIIGLMLNQYYVYKRNLDMKNKLESKDHKTLKELKYRKKQIGKFINALSDYESLQTELDKLNIQ